jgi:hypothetical protein
MVESNPHSNSWVYSSIENSLSNDISLSRQSRLGKSPTIYKVLLEP